MLVRTSTEPDLMPSVEISQPPCLASNVTDASLACPYVPPPFVVMPGRKPLVHVAPPLVDVAKPMFDEPPPNTRPTWKVETIVEPKLYVSGSTSVLCCACASVYGSALTRVVATLAADAELAVNSRTAPTAATTSAGRWMGCMVASPSSLGVESTPPYQSRSAG